ncbi:hypothetical protein DFP72DRAFT_904621 [Ephemerocybe angulata]|uniref:Uncharacterized protein n=1 Tax=Ephemerocybe angulata TaxID=980116 RepID=A0A8H6HVQ0_9AGAR|nr:hypothetical protein DFP72DRAFT_904621 [Tulosesus angulatus]
MAFHNHAGSTFNQNGEFNNIAGDYHKHETHYQQGSKSYQIGSVKNANLGDNYGTIVQGGGGGAGPRPTPPPMNNGFRPPGPPYGMNPGYGPPPPRNGPPPHQGSGYWPGPPPPQHNYGPPGSQGQGYAQPGYDNGGGNGQYYPQAQQGPPPAQQRRQTAPAGPAPGNRNPFLSPNFQEPPPQSRSAPPDPYQTHGRQYEEPVQNEQGFEAPRAPSRDGSSSSSGRNSRKQAPARPLETHPEDWGDSDEELTNRMDDLQVSPGEGSSKEKKKGKRAWWKRQKTLD